MPLSTEYFSSEIENPICEWIVCSATVLHIACSMIHHINTTISFTILAQVSASNLKTRSNISLNILTVEKYQDSFKLILEADILKINWN